MADRLARRELSRLERCPHYYDYYIKAEESINHILPSCVFIGFFLSRLFQREGLLLEKSSLMIDGRRLFLRSKDKCRNYSNLLWFLEFGPFGIITTYVCLMVCLLVWLELYCSLVRKFNCRAWPWLKISFRQVVGDVALLPFEKKKPRCLGHLARDYFI